MKLLLGDFGIKI